MALLQRITWGGLTYAVESFHYTCSHGISPGLAQLVVIPRGRELPVVFGDLVFSDGQRLVRLPGCKADAINPSIGPAGTTWAISIFDRRWRWRTAAASYGAVSGRYNRLDGRTKLVPWTIRNPTELATLCLDAMGERNYVIDLPDGVARIEGADLDRYLEAGENFRERGVNPPVVWDHTPPAEALARLCDEFGRRVVYQPGADRVVITRVGVGRALPGGPCELLSAVLDSPETPESVNVAGAPVRFQCRMALEPVGLEWDDTYRPIDELSYAPPGVESGSAQVVAITHVGADPNGGIELVIRITLPSGLIAVHTFRETDGGTTLADKLTAIAAQINASTAGATVTAEAVGSVLTITGRAAGESFGVEVTDPLVSDETFRTVVTPAVKGETVAAWEYCGPPSYHAVRATERLTKEDAIERARASVYRCYRVRFVDLETGKPPLSIPGYGPLKRRQQIILEPTKVEQVLPEPREPGRRLDVQAPLGFGKPPDYYNGYSRDEGASVYGSYSSQIGNVIWDGGFGNSPADGKVYVPFSIDPYEQVVTFSEPVFELPAIANGSRYQKPTLLLETSVLVLDPDTDAPVRYTRERRIGGAGPPEWVVAEDAQVGVVAEYAAGGRKVQATTHVDRDDADRRADRYLDGMQLKYQLKGGETRQYIGIYPIDPDGLVQQVTWTLGGGGPGTTASTNHEHSVDVLPYPVRRRAENLPPNASAAVANIAEQDKLSKAGLLGSIGLGGRVLRGLR